MDWRVVFSTRSKNDLQKIVAYIARDDPAAAQRFGLLLIDHAESLSHAPDSGVRLAERPGTRFLPCGLYLIIYRAEPHDQTVRILRFWHDARGKRPLR